MICSLINEYYYYDGWRVLSETNAAGTIQRNYTYGNYLDEALIMTDTTGTPDVDYYYAHNHLYSPVALIYSDGTVVERYEYDVYGKQYFYNSTLTALLDPQKSTKNNPVMFTGQRLDSLDAGDLPLMYYKNRYYCTTTGRFLQRDPIGVNDEIALTDFPANGSPKFSRKHNAQRQYNDGMNLYQYVASDPVRLTDSYGLSLSPWQNDYIRRGGLRPSAPLPKPKKCGICGPDVTEPLKRLRQQIIQDFRKLSSVEEQIAKCTGLWGGASWDVKQLYDPALLPNRGCATGDCAGTVQVGGKCYSSHAVNYYMYGTMHSLCSLAPEKTVRIGMLWPLLISGDASCKSKWAWAGLGGNTTGIQCSGYDSCKACQNSFQGRFSYKWKALWEQY